MDIEEAAGEEMVMFTARSAAAQSWMKEQWPDFDNATRSLSIPCRQHKAIALFKLKANLAWFTIRSADRFTT